MEESQPDRQDSWPLVGKAISLSTLQRTTARAQGWGGSGWHLSQSFADSPMKQHSPGGRAHPQLCQEHSTDPSG